MAEPDAGGGAAPMDTGGSAVETSAPPRMPEAGGGAAPERGPREPDERAKAMKIDGPWFRVRAAAEDTEGSATKTSAPPKAGKKRSSTVAFASLKDPGSTGQGPATASGKPLKVSRLADTLLLKKLPFFKQLEKLEQAGTLEIYEPRPHKREGNAFEKMQGPSNDLCNLLATEKDMETLKTAIGLEGSRIKGVVNFKGSHSRGAIHYLISNPEVDRGTAKALCSKIHDARKTSGSLTPVAHDEASFPIDSDLNIKSASINALTMAVIKKRPAIVYALCDQFEQLVLETPGLINMDFSENPYYYTVRTEKEMVRADGNLRINKQGDAEYTSTSLYVALVQDDPDSSMVTFSKSSQCALTIARSKYYARRTKSFICQEAIRTILFKKRKVYTDYSRLGIAVAHLDDRSGLSEETESNLLDALVSWLFSTDQQVDRTQLHSMIKAALLSSTPNPGEMYWHTEYSEVDQIPEGLWWFVHSLIRKIIESRIHTPKLVRGSPDSDEEAPEETPEAKYAMGRRVEDFTVSLLDQIAAILDEGESSKLYGPSVDESPGYNVLEAAIFSRSKRVFSALMQFYAGLDLSTVYKKDNIRDFTGIKKAKSRKQRYWEWSQPVGGIRKPRSTRVVKTYRVATRQAGEEEEKQTFDVESKRPGIATVQVPAQDPGTQSVPSLGDYMRLDADAQGRTYGEYLGIVQGTPKSGAGEDESTRKLAIERAKQKEEFQKELSPEERRLLQEARRDDRADRREEMMAAARAKERRARLAKAERHRRITSAIEKKERREELTPEEEALLEEVKAERRKELEEIKLKSEVGEKLSAAEKAMLEAETARAKRVADIVAQQQKLEEERKRLNDF